jgi:hypothetical protein
MRNHDYTREVGLPSAEVRVPPAIAAVIMVIVIGVAALLIWHVLKLRPARQEAVEPQKPAVRLTSR